MQEITIPTMTTSDKCGKISNHYTESTLIRGEANFTTKSGSVYKIRSTEETFAIGPNWYIVHRDRGNAVIDVTRHGGGDDAVNLPKVITHQGAASVADQKIYKGITENYFQTAGDAKPEMVHHPKHYNSHPANIECIDVIEHMTLNIGNAVKYCWRAGLKSDKTHIEDLKKAIWYLQREVERLSKQQ